jgi:hypothetical protein
MPQAGMFGRLDPHPRRTHPRVTVDNYWDFGSVLPHATPHVARLVPYWPMYLNDQLGDCTEACKAHIMQALSLNGAGTEITVSDSTVEGWYERDAGYVPGDPSTDNGAVIQDVLQNWQDDDQALFPISAFGELRDFYHIAAVKEALYLFGSVYLGINVPQSAMDQFNNGEPWTYVGDQNIVGGHAIPIQEIMPAGQLDVVHVVTWGQLQPMNIAFMHNYVEEAWVVVSKEWFNSSGVDPSGLNLSQLQADFNLLA